MRIKKKHQYGSHRLAGHTRWRLQAAATQTNAPYGAWRGQIISAVAARYLEDCALQIASPAIIGKNRTRPMDNSTEVAMSRIRRPEHIVMDRDLHHGDPCIEGTRIPVATIVGSLADGTTHGQIRQAYLQIRDDHIVAALCVGTTGPVPDERTCGREPGSQGTPALNLSSG